MKFAISEDYDKIYDNQSKVNDLVSVTSSKFPNFKNDETFSNSIENKLKASSDLDFLDEDIFKVPKQTKESKKEK